MSTGAKDYLKLGDWNAYCDGCKFKFKASELKIDWKGLYKCPSCWDARHPMDLQQAPRPSKPIPWTRPTDEVAGLQSVDGEVIDSTTYNSGASQTVPTGTFTTNNGTL